MSSSICITDTTFIKNNLSKEEKGTNYRNRRAANSIRQWWLTNKNNKRKQKIKLRIPIWNIGWTLKGFREKGKLIEDTNRVIILDFSPLNGAISYVDHFFKVKKMHTNFAHMKEKISWNLQLPALYGTRG